MTDRDLLHGQDRCEWVPASERSSPQSLRVAANKIEHYNDPKLVTFSSRFTTSPMIIPRQITAAEIALVESLASLLIDAVTGGASVGFLRPLSVEAARRYWVRVFANLGNGLVMWVAEEAGVVVGLVQLDLCGKENGQHRAEVQKLFVLSSHRGRGISRLLMNALEAYGRANGRTLLVLDTQAGSVAEGVYVRLGWVKSGEIPDFAADPDGTLRATSYFYKRLEG